MPLKLTFHYGSGDDLVEVWCDGPHAASGYVADALLGTDGARETPRYIEIHEDASDVPDINVPGKDQEDPSVAPMTPPESLTSDPMPTTTPRSFNVPPIGDKPENAHERT